jgi:hypothetical protein
MKADKGGLIIPGGVAAGTCLRKVLGIDTLTEHAVISGGTRIP